MKEQASLPDRNLSQRFEKALDILGKEESLFKRVRALATLRAVSDLRMFLGFEPRGKIIDFPYNRRNPNGPTKDSLPPVG